MARNIDTLRSMAKLLEVAKKIAENIDSYERELGRPVNETFVHPSTGKTEDNAVTVNMRLLNELRAAIKELK